MAPVDPSNPETRPIAGSVLMIFALIISISVTFLVLLSIRHDDLIRSSGIAADYHLTATVRAGAIEGLLGDVDRRLRLSSHDTQQLVDESDVAAIRRSVHLVERETRALEAAQRQFAEPRYDAPLRRLLVQQQRFAERASMLTGEDPAEGVMMLERLDHFRLRLDQFSGLHRQGYLARDTMAARIDGWRRFVLLSIVVSVAGLLMIALAARQIVVRIRERENAERRHRLLRIELDHRVKNNLAAVLSLAEQTARSSSDLQAFMRTFTGRIVAMSRTHEALAEKQWSGIDMAHVAVLALETRLDAHSSPIDIEGGSVLLPARAALPMGLVLHELSTNAAKHGALSVPGGRVSLTWSAHDRGLDLNWVERGGPVVIEPKIPGVGTELIDGFIRHELRGEVEIDYRPDGLACRISVPLGDETPT